jgi:FkbM family methyltransferase
MWSHEAALHRRVVRAANRVLARLPFGFKYGVGLRLRRGRPPYALIRPGDVVVQIGAPHDTLRAGRSRAFYFGLLVGPAGRVIVCEPDAKSAAALQDAARRHGHDNLTVINAGAWNEKTTLRFYIDDAHPASNFTEGAKEYDEKRMQSYRCVEMPAVRLDEVLAGAGVERVRLISITTNGAEREIIEGLGGRLPDVEYISIADTGVVDPAEFESQGFNLFSYDDRGRTFARALTGDAPARAIRE